jgi:hypothetical protein
LTKTTSFSSSLPLYQYTYRGKIAEDHSCLLTNHCHQKFQFSTLSKLFRRAEYRSAIIIKCILNWTALFHDLKNVIATTMSGVIAAAMITVDNILSFWIFPL